jgi:hypothetical protein
LLGFHSARRRLNIVVMGHKAFENLTDLEKRKY